MELWYILLLKRKTPRYIFMTWNLFAGNLFVLTLLLLIPSMLQFHFWKEFRKKEPSCVKASFWLLWLFLYVICLLFYWGQWFVLHRTGIALCYLERECFFAGFATALEKTATFSEALAHVEKDVFNAVENKIFFLCGTFFFAGGISGILGICALYYWIQKYVRRRRKKTGMWVLALSVFFAGSCSFTLSFAWKLEYRMNWFFAHQKMFLKECRNYKVRKSNAVLAQHLRKYISEKKYPFGENSQVLRKIMEDDKDR